MAIRYWMINGSVQAIDDTLLTGDSASVYVSVGLLNALIKYDEKNNTLEIGGGGTYLAP